MSDDLNDKLNELEGRVGEGLPEVKRARVGDELNEDVTIKDKEGKEHPARIKHYTEAEVEDKTLIKIAPMFYFSVESKKIIMIPFSIKFTPEEFLKQTATQAINLKGIIEKVDELHIEDEVAKIYESNK